MNSDLFLYRIQRDIISIANFKAAGGKLNIYFLHNCDLHSSEMYFWSGHELVFIMD